MVCIALYSKFVIFRFDPTLTFAYAVIIYLLQLYIKLNYFPQFKYIMHVCNPCTFINFYYLSVTWVIVVCCTLPAINMLGYFEKAVWVFQYLIYLTFFFKVYYRTILSIQLFNLKLNNDGWCFCKYNKSSSFKVFVLRNREKKKNFLQQDWFWIEIIMNFYFST